MRDDGTKAQIGRIKEMAEMPPATLIASAVMLSPDAVEFTTDHAEKSFNFIKKQAVKGGGHGMASLIILCSALGYTVGKMMNTKMTGAGEVADHLIDIATKVVRDCAERGFAEAREEDQRNV